jgi:hypothetical protein
VNHLCELLIDMQSTNGAVVSMGPIIYVCIESSLSVQTLNIGVLSRSGDIEIV